MDEATRLRRQFRRTRENDDMANLILKGGIYHYNRRVPASVLARDPSLPKSIRRSTGTDRRREAQAQAREWAQEDEEAWLSILQGRGAVSRWRAGLRTEHNRTLEQAIDLLESRADKLRVREELEAMSPGETLPEVLLNDPQAGPAARALYEANGHFLSWQDAWDRFEARSGLKPKTRLAYVAAIRKFDAAKLPPPHAISREPARQFLKDAALRVTPSTVRVYIAAASAVLADLFDDDRARTFQGHKLRHALAPSKREPITKSDIEALIGDGKLRHDVGVFVRLCLGTGARPQEAYFGSYDIKRRILSIPAEYAKQSKAREVPLSDIVVPVAQEWLKLREMKRVRSLQAIRNAFAKSRDAAGLPPSKSLHSCRHSFTTQLARRGVPQDRRKCLTGHSTASDVHAGYIHLEVEDLRQDVEKVDFETGIPWP